MNISLMCDGLLMGNDGIAQVKFMVVQFVDGLFVSSDLFSGFQSKIFMLIVQV
jgi:hypothetical protein